MRSCSVSYVPWRVFHNNEPLYKNTNCNIWIYRIVGYFLSTPCTPGHAVVFCIDMHRPDIIYTWFVFQVAFIYVYIMISGCLNAIWISYCVYLIPLPPPPPPLRILRSNIHSDIGAGYLSLQFPRLTKPHPSFCLCQLLSTFHCPISYNQRFEARFKWY